jgi:excisionase family DNA binding protein
VRKPDETKADELVTPADLARRFGVTIETVRGWVREGRVPYLRPSRRVVRFRLADVERAIRHTAQGGER